MSEEEKEIEAADELHEDEVEELDEDEVEELDEDEVEELDEDEVEELDEDEVEELDEDEVEELDEDEVEELDEDEKKKIEEQNLVEAALFVAARSVSLDELRSKTGIKKREIQKYISDLSKDYQLRNTALELVEVGEEKYSLQLKPKYTNEVKNFAEGGLISEAVMRTLTIIALKQPLLKSTLVKLRGSGAYQHVKELEDDDFVESEKKGRSSVLYTTDRFADTFGLSRDKKAMKQELKKQLGVGD